MKKIIVDKFVMLKRYFLSHKIKGSIILIVLVGLGYWAVTAFGASGTATQYTIGLVEKGSISSTISGTGQVSASNQVDLKSKTSGDVIYVGVTSGQKISRGTLIAQLDTVDAQKAVRDAEINLESAKLSYQKLIAPADNLSMIQAENALAQATTNLQKAYDDGYGSVSDTYLDLPSVMSGMQDIFYGTSVNKTGGQDNISAYTDMIKNYDENVLTFRDDAIAKYKKARDAYEASLLDYRSSSRFSDNATIENLVENTYSTTKTISDSVKSMNDLLNFIKDNLVKRNQSIPSILTTHQNSLGSYTSTTNSSLLSLLNNINTITSSQYSLKEKTESLADLKSGASDLDRQSSELSVKQRENALQDAKDNLSNSYIVAPFDGTIASLSIKKGDSLSSSASIGTFITDQKIAEISLNEVDVSKVKIGQKVDLTFDAIDDLKITGEVVEIDTIGTVSQGVVSYSVKISFGSQDERVKSGMSVNASIITNEQNDVLIVPSSAIKTLGEKSFVEVLQEKISMGNRKTQTTTQAVIGKLTPVVLGISDDTNTEIVSGLNEGDQIIVKTVAGTKTVTVSKTNTATSLLGGGRATGGVRITR